MLERNRTFGRVSRPVDKAAAPRQALEHQRRAGRAKHATMAPPNARTARLRETPRVVATPPAAIASNETVLGAVAAEMAVPPVAPDAVANEPATLAEAAPPVDPAATETPERPAEAPAVVIGTEEARTAAVDAAPILAVAMDPALRPPPRPAARRRPVLRLATAASVALAGLVTFARFSDAHRPVPALSLATPAASIGAAEPASAALPQVAALTQLPDEASLLPPATTAYGSGDPAETAALPPSAAERVTARAGAAPEKAEAPAGQAVPPRKPTAGKPVASRIVAPRVRGEASRPEPSRGPILDFLSDLIP